MIFPSSVPKGRCDRRYIGHSLYNPQRKGANELHALGRHLVLELNGCNPKLLNDVKRVEEIMVAAAKIAKATIVGTHFHQFSPFGISGIVVIAESHVSVHTWPEHGYAAVDIFTCGETLTPEVAVQYLVEKVQSTQADEFIYHEVLVHPAMLVHPDPKRVMVIGGGEGATLREVLRHRSVERALMVDIDREVVEVSRAMLPEFHAGAFDDPRTELAFEDARRWLETHDQVFDVIIIDLSDPIEEGPCYLLYTREVYRLVNRRLSPQGTIALQSGSVAPHDLLNFSAIYRTLLTAFPVVCPYVANVPCFGLPWGFQMASKEVNPRAYSAADYDKMIARRIQGELKYLTGEVCKAQMALPKHLQARLASETRLIEDDAPLYIYHDHARAL